ncbi:hypothetical protein EU803_15210 [Loktanella sp. IMCC34160]|uniref:Hint domain-containing protein n=1 Tax=Loktanella sp. IMCC34160 TaxID=2510646 RepID=UPI00101C2D06|nr:Hint domain-containing protein [Loktanella sp. IMCC34160]RYG89965.1 hypothetical protein EU803_15210 [Loktanella sp. IMCC34160]
MIGYLVDLGTNCEVDRGDSISTVQVTFTEDSLLGTGAWLWTGTAGTGSTYLRYGSYHLGSDGSTYVIPDADFPTSGTATAYYGPYDIVGTFGADKLVGTTGDDLINGRGGDDTLFGGEGRDAIDGGFGDDIVYVDGGDDVIDSDAGHDTVYGGAGNDNLRSGDGDDVVYGGAGNEENSLGSSGGTNTVFGDAGNDSVWVGTGNDIVYGGLGNDTITFAEGDVVLGDGGDDTFLLENLGEPANGTITVTGGNDAETLGGGDTLQLGDLADLSTLNITSTTTNASGNTSYSGSVTLDDGTTLNFSEIESIVCFTRGTLIKTIDGERLIQDLRPGDWVLTYDRGYQPLRWIGSTRVAAFGKFAPIRFARGVLGNDRPLLVSPQIRMLLSGWRAELYTGKTEVLVPALHLVNDSTITRLIGGEVDYFHMLFDQHELVFSNGCVSESFHPGEQSWSALCEEARQETFDLFPDPISSGFNAFGDAARYSVKRNEAHCLAEDLDTLAAESGEDARAYVA